MRTHNGDIGAASLVSHRLMWQWNIVYQTNLGCRRLHFTYFIVLLTLIIQWAATAHWNRLLPAFEKIIKQQLNQALTRPLSITEDFIDKDFLCFPRQIVSHAWVLFTNGIYALNRINALYEKKRARKAFLNLFDIWHNAFTVVLFKLFSKNSQHPNLWYFNRQHFLYVNRNKSSEHIFICIQLHVFLFHTHL